MKQTEKLDIILKELYNKGLDGKFHNLNQLLTNLGYDFRFSEVYALAQRLDNEGLIKMHGTTSVMSSIN